jgi:NAD(P)-dependent dehydrogenase (short-subunit alcohol dehydrogenase family)
MGKLAGKIAVITGGNSGIGLASASRFVADGARVFITGRRQEQLDAAVKSIGPGVTAIQGDVSKPADLDRIFDTVKGQAGRIDVLFANAGLGDGMLPLGHITEKHFDTIFNTNVRGTVFTVQKALPLMRAGGSIIVTGSTTTCTGTPAFSIYSASKAALRALVRNWALDLKGTGLRINMLSPGATETPGLMNGLAKSGKQQELVAILANSSVFGRLARPEEPAAVAAFLASDDSGFMTGSEVFVDGGSAQV